MMEPNAMEQQFLKKQFSHLIDSHVIGFYLFNITRRPENCILNIDFMRFNCSYEPIEISV